MAKWIDGTVTGRRDWSGRVHSLQVEADIAPFVAGQFIKLGLPIDGEVVGRPYSLINPPQLRPLEFCFSIVPDGPLSPRLASLNPGGAIFIAAQANGFLTLPEVPPARHLWLIATGTGIGPFLSILHIDEAWQRFERVILLHAVRHAAELLYRDRISLIEAGHAAQFAYVPFVSREATDFALPGRIPQAIADGTLEARAGAAIDEHGHYMLCGNPAMVEDVTTTLVSRGLRKHRRKEPGHISVENYW